ncbi:MAG: ferritin [Candidatus Margulisiibacteriota bacterium]|nr:MAG: hypothetical protein A2X43_13920 [Candidatus Margulisbacteria bacterium GWD2_39_127]OGI05525.1 MAG: hypothetical protein A2X42_00530 [Candidatus Margulisbacteria bacterium GWF2_38_17]OGI08394.1 MAG: hypothetical protein A2X41_10810 [Candidatus Margulisbacteria bacterium GWE2_39_32]PZM77365.1 MAG: ferritin [Candidatus Margulisiibacteriota bacterium]HAR63125.1 ferritin [Candidatus Margulisiibacteriota bacterium]
MDNSTLISILNSLIQLDFDADEGYHQAMKQTKDKVIHGQLGTFCADHERHIANLTVLVRSYGGIPVEPVQDINGIFIEGYTRLRRSTGTEGLLQAVESNEKITNREYKAAADMDLPLNVKSVIEINFADEKRHLGYLNSALAKRIWEQGRRAA